MAKTPTEVTIDVKFNSREMQEWLAQAWQAGAQYALDQWYDRFDSDEVEDVLAANPFTDESDSDPVE